MYNVKVMSGHVSIHLGFAFKVTTGIRMKFGTDGLVYFGLY
jgi:hypothetical protein